jgi:hypothetical protein
MTFVHAFLEGVICAGVFAALCTNFLVRDGAQTRLKMKNYKKKNKQNKSEAKRRGCWNLYPATARGFLRDVA